MHHWQHTLVSRFLKRFLMSESSGAVIRLLFKFCTMMLANSISWSDTVSENSNQFGMYDLPLPFRGSLPKSDRYAPG